MKSGARSSSASSAAAPSSTEAMISSSGQSLRSFPSSWVRRIGSSSATMAVGMARFYAAGRGRDAWAATRGSRCAGGGLALARASTRCRGRGATKGASTGESRDQHHDEPRRCATREEEEAEAVDAPATRCASAAAADDEADQRAGERR